MSPNIRPSSSSESSSGYSARQARSVPSSPDRKFGPSAGATTATAAAAAAAPSASPDMCPRPSLSAAGRSVSSRTMSSSGSYIHVGKPSTGAAASKPSLARAKSDKVRTTATSQRPPVLAVPPSNSFKDMARTAAAAKSPSTLPKSKVSPRPCTEKGVGIQRAPSPGASRGGKITPPVPSARAPVAAAKKRVEKAANGGASASSRAASASQRATRKEKEEEPSMQFEASESLTTSIEDHLQKRLPDPVDLKSMGSAASGSVRHGHQQEPYSEQQGKSGEEVKEHSHKEEKGGGCELRNGKHGADELEGAEKEEAKAMAEVTQSWRKDDPTSNDVIEETKSKLLEERKSRVKALVGAFETVMSFKE